MYCKLGWFTLWFAPKKEEIGSRLETYRASLAEMERSVINQSFTVSFFFTRKVAARAKHSSLPWFWISEPPPPLVLWILDFRHQKKPFRGNYSKLYYVSNRYLLAFTHAKKTKEFDGTTFKAIPLVYAKQMSENLKYVSRIRVYIMCNHLVGRRVHVLLCFFAVVSSLQTP